MTDITPDGIGVPLPGALGTASLSTASNAWRSLPELRFGMLAWFAMSITLGVSPVYPDMARDVGVSASGIGLMIGFGSALSAIAQFPFGMLADRGAMRRLTILGVALAAVSTTMWAVAYAPEFLALGWLFSGLAAPALQAGSLTALLHVAPPTARSRAMGAIWAASSAGSCLALLLFATLTQSTGWRIPVAVSGVVPLVVTILLLTRLRHTPAPAVHASTATVARATLALLRDRRTLPLIIVAGLLAALSAGTQLMATFLLHEHGVSASHASLLLLSLVGGAIVGAPLVCSVADRVGVVAPLVVGPFGCAACYVISALRWPGLFVFAAILWLTGAITAGGLSVVTGLTAGIVEAAGRMGIGTTMAGVRILLFAGSAAAPAAVGAVLRRSDSGAQLLVAGLAVAAAIVAVLIRVSTAGGTHDKPRETPTDVAPPKPPTSL